METEQAGKNTAGLDMHKVAMAARERTWSECCMEEKVERTREALLRLGAHGFVVMPVIESPTQWDEGLRFDLRHMFARLR